MLLHVLRHGRVGVGDSCLFVALFEKGF